MGADSDSGSPGTHIHTVGRAGSSSQQGVAVGFPGAAERPLGKEQNAQINPWGWIARGGPREKNLRLR